MNEANEMGIFHEGPGDGVDYTKALEKIQESIKQKESEPNQIDSGSSNLKKKGSSEELSDYDNEDLYN